MVMPAHARAARATACQCSSSRMVSLLSQVVIPWLKADLISSPSRRKRSPCMNSSAILLPTMRSPLFLRVLALRAAFSVALGGNAQGSDGLRRCARHRCRWARCSHHQRLVSTAVESVLSSVRGLRMCMSLVHVHGWYVWSILCEKKTMRHCSFLVALILGHRAAPRLSLP